MSAEHLKYLINLSLAYLLIKFYEENICWSLHDVIFVRWANRPSPRRSLCTSSNLPAIIIYYIARHTQSTYMNIHELSSAGIWILLITAAIVAACATMLYILYYIEYIHQLICICATAPMCCHSFVALTNLSSNAEVVGFESMSMF